VGDAAPAVLRPLVPVRHALSRHRHGTEGYRIDPDFHASEGIAINEENELRRQQLTAWITMHLEDRPDLIEQSIPTTRRWGNGSCRTTGRGCTR